MNNDQKRFDSYDSGACFSWAGPGQVSRKALKSFKGRRHLQNTASGREKQTAKEK
jgi:hypothetical protein